MLAKEMYDIFLVEFEQMAETMQRKFTPVHPKVFAYWLSEGEAEIRTMTGFYEKTKTIPVVSGQSDYMLPADFSMDVMVQASNEELVRKNVEEVLISDNTGIYGIYFSGSRWYIKVSLVSSATSFSVTYKLGTQINPDAADYFDGDEIYNEIGLPDEAISTLKEYLMGKVFPELSEKYRTKILRLKALSGTRHNTKISYKMDVI